MPTISVIVPIYNAENYLRCSVESILAQTFTDIEILLVDDGSTDNSSSICDAYAHMDNRVRVFHKTNGGVSSARNLGLNKAVGRWIMFVDSDDKVDRTICEQLLEHADKGCMPICYCYKWTNNEIGRFFDQLNEGPYYSVRDFEKIGLMIHSSWAKLYERDIIEREQLAYNESISFAEDAIFNYEYLKFLEQIYVVDEQLYYYRILPHSLSRGKYLSDMDRGRIILSKQRLELAKFLSIADEGFLSRHYKDYFFNTHFAFQNNMRVDAPGTIWQKMQRNNAILRSEEFMKSFSYRNDWPMYFSKRYIKFLELSYYTRNFFWLYILGLPGKIKVAIRERRKQ